MLDPALIVALAPVLTPARALAFGRFFAVFPLVLVLGCAGDPRPKPKTAASTQVRSDGASSVTRDPLNQDELILRDGLKATILHLKEKIGERHREESWQLSEAADYLAEQISERGFAVERQGYELEDIAAHNLTLTIPGGERGDQVLVLGASYDSLRGEAGEDVGGAEVAALLELARLMRGARLVRTLKIVFYALGQSPMGDGEARGARHYARALAAEMQASGREHGESGTFSQRSTIGAVQLHALGHFAEIGASEGPIHVTVSRTPGSEKLYSYFADEFSASPYELTAAKFIDGSQGDSSDAAFFENGVPSLTLSGTGAVGSRGLGPVHYDDLARVVMRIRGALGAILGEKPTNDQMLTPLLPSFS